MIERAFLIIDGERVHSVSGETYEDPDPSTGEVLSLVSRAKAEDIDAAVASAHQAFENKWYDMAPEARGRILHRIGELILERAEELALLESRDTGKPLSQGKGDVKTAARYFEFYAGVADKIMGDTIPVGSGLTAYTVREPLGVSAQIVPWNFPIHLSSRGVAPALAAGNCVVLKPALEAPLTSIRLGELALEAGLPAGVLNVVPGDGPEAGASLARHPGVNQITFTGSVESGVSVMKAAAENVVPVVLELGGKSPNLVFADADLEQAAARAARGVFLNAGQSCSAGSRLLVERPAHKWMVEAMIGQAGRVRLGPGVEDPDMGPLISQKQLDRVLEYIDVGRREGARVLTGGGRPQDSRLKRGYFVQPTLLDEVSNEMRVAQEEIFGPVLSIIPFDGVEEAIELANRSRYGLVAGIWTRDISKAHSVAARIRTGQVFINTFGGGNVALPFGGYKKSGFGRERGLEALGSYTQSKTVCIQYG